jgi:hypothetical protein
MRHVHSGFQQRGNVKRWRFEYAVLLVVGVTGAETFGRAEKMTDPAGRAY